MGDDNAKNILYGGPEPELIDAEAKSFGEVILKKLTVNENNVIFVSIKLCALSTRKYSIWKAKKKKRGQKKNNNKLLSS